MLKSGETGIGVRNPPSAAGAAPSLQGFGQQHVHKQPRQQSRGSSLQASSQKQQKGVSTASSANQAGRPASHNIAPKRAQPKRLPPDPEISLITSMLTGLQLEDFPMFVSSR